MEANEAIPTGVEARRKATRGAWRPYVRAVARVVAALGLFAHGIGHAVFPLRGAGTLESSHIGRLLGSSAWIVALLGFSAAGLALLGVRPLPEVGRRLTAGSVVASLLAIAVSRGGDLLVGAGIDALVVFVILGGFLSFDSAAVKTRHRRASARGHGRVRIGELMGYALLAYLAVAATTRSWHGRWGSSARELAMSLPGDRPGRDPAFEVNHAITIDAPPHEVWPWLAQIGQDRGGFYSYDWLERLFGLHIHNADRVHPEWQERVAGDRVYATPQNWLGLLRDPVGWRIAKFEAERVLVLEGWGAFVLVPTVDGGTRFIVRSQVSAPSIPVWGAALSFATFELPHFIMERRMLLGIQERAQKAGAELAR